MRILFVSPYLPSMIRVRTYNLLRELGRRHEVRLLATDSIRNLGDARSLQPFCRSLHLVPLRLADSVRGCASAAVRGEPLQAAFCRSPQFQAQLDDLLERYPFDVVHLEHFRAAHLEARLPPDLPSLFDSVDCISLLLERTLESSHSLRQRVVAAMELSRSRAYEARLLSRFDRVMVTAPEDRRALLSLLPTASVTVVPNGVDLDYFRPVAGQRDPATLVFSGKMSYHANVTALLHFVQRIFPHIRRSWPEVRLRIVGSNPPSSVTALSRDPAVSVTGYLPDIREALGRATVAICPIRVKVGIQNKVLEAMAMGLPVVCTTEGAQGLTAEPGQDLLVASSALEFAEQVCRLLADRRLRDQISRAGRRYVETYHRWEAAASKVESLYGEAIDHRRRSQVGEALQAV